MKEMDEINKKLGELDEWENASVRRWQEGGDRDEARFKEEIAENLPLK